MHVVVAGRESRATRHENHERDRQAATAEADNPAAGAAMSWGGRFRSTRLAHHDFQNLIVGGEHAGCRNFPDIAQTFFDRVTQNTVG